MKPNPGCDEYHCKKRVEKRAQELKDNPEEVKEEQEEEAVVHEDNDWGISLVSEDVGDADAGGSQEVTSGISTAYSFKEKAAEPVEEEINWGDEEESLEDLMAKNAKL